MLTDKNLKNYQSEHNRQSRSNGSRRESLGNSLGYPINFTNLSSLSRRNSKRLLRKNSTISRRSSSSQLGTAYTLVNKPLWSGSVSPACTKRPTLRPSLSSGRSSVYWKHCYPKLARTTEENRDIGVERSVRCSVAGRDNKTATWRIYQGEF